MSDNRLQAIHNILSQVAELQHDVKSVTRSVLEGKPLLSVERQEVEEQEAKERFVGRLIVLVLGAVLIGERITGKGAVQALDHAVGVPLWEIEPLLGAIVVGLLIAALYPRRRQLVQDAQRRKKEFGDWLADAQVWVRRLACVSLASTIVVEVVTGKGALALLDIETGVETLSEIEAGAAFLIMLFLTAAEPKRSYR
ncbi:g6275 [Coccomyxa elongata]